jgi:hypothetical protein
MATHSHVYVYIAALWAHRQMGDTPAGGGQTDTPAGGGQADTPAGGGQADIDAHAMGGGGDAEGAPTRR